MAYVKFSSSGGGGGGPQTPPFASRMLTERLLDGVFIDGTAFFEAGSCGLKERGG